MDRVLVNKMLDGTAKVERESIEQRKVIAERDAIVDVLKRKLENRDLEIERLRAVLDDEESLTNRLRELARDDDQ